MTNYLTIDNTILFLLIRSINLPGVAIKISHPLYNSLCCYFMSAPPYTTHDNNPVPHENFLDSSNICTANSLVGDSIKAIGTAMLKFILLFIGGPSRNNFSIIGNTYAAVLPEPVCAHPIISLLFNASYIIYF